MKLSNRTSRKLNSNLKPLSLRVSKSPNKSPRRSPTLNRRASRNLNNLKPLSLRLSLNKSPRRNPNKNNPRRSLNLNRRVNLKLNNNSGAIIGGKMRVLNVKIGRIGNRIIPKLVRKKNKILAANAATVNLKIAGSVSAKTAAIEIIASAIATVNLLTLKKPLKIKPLNRATANSVLQDLRGRKIALRLNLSIKQKSPARRILRLAKALLLKIWQAR